MNNTAESIKKKYSDLLKAGKDALDTLKIPFKVRKAEKDLEKEIIDLEQKIAESELKIQEAKGSENLKLKSILEAINNKQLLERELKIANELKEELF